MLSYFMILSAIFKIISVICYNAKLFCKIAQPFSIFCDAGVDALGGRLLGSGGSWGHAVRCAWLGWSVG
jgi:hypothetical protein